MLHRLPPGRGWRHIALWLRKPLKRALGERVDAEVLGLKLRLHSRGKLSEQRLLLMPQFLGTTERNILARELKAGDVFLDIGANVAGYSRCVASNCEAGVRVEAFEPDPELCRRLRFNLQANGPAPVASSLFGRGCSRAALALGWCVRQITDTRTTAGLCGGSFYLPANAPSPMKDGFFNTLSRHVRAPLNRRWAFQRLQEYHSAPRSLKETVQWAMRFGGKGFFRVGTLQIESEILRLAERVQQLGPRRILELGTARGGTLLIWSALASERVISCDLRDLSTPRKLFEALPPPGSKCRVQLLTGDSHSSEFRQRVGDALAGEKVDFLFIDGDHSVEGVTQDYQDYKGFVRSGGLIAFHDIVERQVLPTNQVFQFWKTIRTELNTEEIVADANQSGFGIGVVRVTEHANCEA